MQRLFFHTAEERSVPADVCLIAEGCYPYVIGGVSAWIDWLIRSQPHLTFEVVAISATNTNPTSRYAFPPNLRRVHDVFLDDMNFGGAPGRRGLDPHEFAQATMALLGSGQGPVLADLARIVAAGRRRGLSLHGMLNSPEAWEAVCVAYSAYAHCSFLAFFWAWRTLVGGVLRMLLCPLPDARAYHSVSTGYAGLLGARAAIETGRPLVVTEHGIYSNERRVEILMADWIIDSIDTGGDFSDDRHDMRHLWGQAFDGFARACYQSCAEVITLYGANQIFQRALGADPDRMRVIPNGIDVDRFSALERTRPERPTIGFVGRVTPIKDLVTFIEMVAEVRVTHPQVEALVLGPLDEDPEYARHCRDLVARLDLGDTIVFTGPVRVDDYLGRLDVLVLTSISEALPLVLLEAGAAGVPCVTTDVGACREILEGRRGERKNAPGGFVAPAGDPEALARAVSMLLSDRELGDALGSNLRKRVRRDYDAAAVAQAYGAVYARHLNMLSEA